MLGRYGELAVVLGGGVAVGREHRHCEFEDAAPGIAGIFGLGHDTHALGGRNGAGGGKSANAVYLDQAGSTGSDGLHIRVFAELRYVGAGLVYRVKDGGAVVDCNLLAVDGECDGHGGPFWWMVIVVRIRDYSSCIPYLPHRRLAQGFLYRLLCTQIGQNRLRRRKECPLSGALWLLS